MWVKLLWKVALAKEEVGGATVGEGKNELFLRDYEGWG